MKKMLLILTVVLAMIEVNAQSVFRTYTVKYLIVDSGNVYPTNGFLTINKDELLYEKDSITKNWQIIDEGIIYKEENKDVRFRFHKFFLVNQKKYLLVSYTKLIKHDGVFYYSLIMDGQTELAL